MATNEPMSGFTFAPCPWECPGEDHVVSQFWAAEGSKVRCTCGAVQYEAYWNRRPAAIPTGEGLKRYDWQVVGVGVFAQPKMLERKNGEFVRHADHVAALRASSTGAQAEGDASDWRDILTDDEKGVMLAVEHGQGDGSIFAIRAKTLHDAIIRIAKVATLPISALPKPEARPEGDGPTDGPDGLTLGNGGWTEANVKADIEEALSPPLRDDHAYARRLADAASAMLNEIRTLRSPGAGAWRPMETAPKDGTEIILEVERRAGMSGKLLVGHYMAGGHCIEDHPPIDAGWYFWNGSMFDKASKPLRWCPAPPAPTTGEAG